MVAFDLGAMLGAPQNNINQVQQIAVNLLEPYHNHMFTLYEGERLEDMVQSIRNNGVLTPLIVQPSSNGKYEILIGHNRWNASKLAGKETVPAIVKQGLTAEEAEMYVIESNIMQRGFGNLKLSEQAAVVAMRQDKMFSQGKRTDIIRELQQIEHPELAEKEKKDASGKKSRDRVGEEYGLSGKTISRLIRISKLIDLLKEQVDSGAIPLLAGVQISYLSEGTQETVALLAEQYKVDVKKAEQLRTTADGNGDLSDDAVEEILSGKSTEAQQPRPKSVKISQKYFTRYFPKGTKSEEVTETIEKALEAYFEPEEKEEENPIPIEALNLSVDAYNHLKRMKINKVSDFDKVVKHYGLENLICRKSVREFMDKLNDYIIRQAQASNVSNSDP